MARIAAVTPESLAEAAALLRAGQLCAFPTETVYGLGADARSEAAVRRIYEVKGRPQTNPLIVHVPSIDEARALAAAWPAEAAALAARFWPGPLTLVLPRGGGLPAVVSAGLPTVALRVPAHPVALALLVACGLPLAAPSANPSERLSPTTAAHVAAGLPAVPLILDGGPCALGIESTVVDLCGARPRLLRPGALSLVQLRAALPGQEILVPAPGAAVAEAEARPAPGMMARHYAPRARLRYAEEAGGEALALLPGPVGLLLRGQGGAAQGDAADVIEVLPEDPEGYGADLYAALHRLDDAGVRTILVQRPPQDEAWAAINDRLRRASA
jgi:L-threonylcarbamoyladenylate synthase